LRGKYQFFTRTSAGVAGGTTMIIYFVYTSYPGYYDAVKKRIEATEPEKVDR